MTTPTDPPKRRPGRPKTRPAELVRLRLDVTPDELELVRRASELSGQSQAAFARAAVVGVARQKLAAPPRKKGEP